jgi:AraC-like DNA-binding protein
MVKYFAAFSGTALPEKFLSLAPSTGVIVQTAVPERIAEVFEQLIDAGIGDTPFRDHACRLIGELLLLRIAETAVPPGTVDTVAFETFVRCRSWIDQHYLEVEGLADICDSCGVHQGHLCKLFKRYARKSPWQHVLGLKMRDAAHQLQTPNILVREVAAALGYADPYQFSRTFHRVLGTWPRTLVHLREQRG